jgi:hypothetical protein
MDCDSRVTSKDLIAAIAQLSTGAYHIPLQVHTPHSYHTTHRFHTDSKLDRDITTYTVSVNESSDHSFWFLSGLEQVQPMVLVSDH